MDAQESRTTVGTARQVMKEASLTSEHDCGADLACFCEAQKLVGTLEPQPMNARAPI